MTDIETRTTVLLDRAFDGVRVEPDLEAVLREETVISLTDHPRDTRRRLARAGLAAAAALLVAVAAAVALMPRDASTPVASEGEGGPTPGAPVVEEPAADPLDPGPPAPDPAGGTSTTVQPPLGTDWVGQTAPILEGATIDGRPVRDPRLDGSWQVVTVVPAGCGLCLDTAASQWTIDDAALSELGDGSVRVTVLVPGDSDRAATDGAREVHLAANEPGWQVVALPDPPSTMDTWRLGVLPASVVIDPDGVVRSVIPELLDGAGLEVALGEIGREAAADG